MSKTIISFDIGIKNLAYCIFSLPDFSVLAWDVVNLVPPTVSISQLCNCQKAKGGMPCGKKASYLLGDNLYCNTHVKNAGKLMPTKETSPSAIKKLKVADLVSFCEKHQIEIKSNKKPDLIASAILHFEKHCLVPISSPKKNNANQVHLVDIGKRIKQEFDERLKTILPNITHVILENQISPIAGRMNTIQGMLTQYFIMRNDTLTIEFISSIGKLKGLNAIADEGTSSTIEDTKELSNSPQISKTTYKEHKVDGIYFCKQFLENNNKLVFLKQIIEISHKKDDLADSFLQGIYFMKRSTMISYTEKFIISIIT